MRIFLWVIASVALCGVVSGCGAGLIKPKGRVVESGSPLKTGKGEHLQVVFHQTDAKTKPMDSFGANVLADGTFEVDGHRGKGIPPGKYRISVEVVDRKGEHDRLKGAFSPDKSPIIRDITSDQEEIIIDVAKPAG